jgi:hypothetical protein
MPEFWHSHDALAGAFSHYTYEHSGRETKSDQLLVVDHQGVQEEHDSTSYVFTDPQIHSATTEQIYGLCDNGLENRDKMVPKRSIKKLGGGGGGGGGSDEDEELFVGAQVEAKCKGSSKHYRGTIMKVNRDGTYYIKFDDGLVDAHMCNANGDKCRGGKWSGKKQFFMGHTCSHYCKSLGLAEFDLKEFCSEPEKMDKKKSSGPPPAGQEDKWESDNFPGHCRWCGRSHVTQ